MINICLFLILSYISWKKKQRVKPVSFTLLDFEAMYKNKHVQHNMFEVTKVIIFL